MDRMNKEDDYIFRYSLEGRETGSSRDSLLEMIRTQVESLLGLLSLYQGDEKMKVDGFRMMNEGEAIHPIFPSLAPEKSSPPSSISRRREGGGGFPEYPECGVV